MSATTAAFTPATAATSAPGTTPEYPRHVVTAVLVAHDGARWLPDALAGLLGQERPVQNVVAADTGSADDSARLLTEALGQERVLHLARRSGFGTAVEEAVRGAGELTVDDLPYLKRPSSWDPVTRSWHDEAYDMPELPHGEPVQWLWLLHDDCAPAPDALAELLRVADSDAYAAVVGPKLRGWYDRRQLLEVGVSIANSGRRWTGLDRREQDQGQHDQVRTVLSVSSAGMLVRRDVWEELGGFDRNLPLMRDDVDLCWRVHAAGHQVLVAPDAVVRHAEAAARERRTVDCVGRSVANPHRVDKAGAVYTMLVNARGAALPWVMLRLVVGTLLRTLGYLVAKAPWQAVDEVTGLLGVLLRPGRIAQGRSRRGRSVAEPSELRPLFPPPGATLRATVEQLVSNLSSGEDADAGGSRHGVVQSEPGGDDADYLEIEQFARLKKLAHKPGPVLFAVLLVVSLVACRGLLSGGSLAGGALLPAPNGVGDLWSSYANTWHPVGTGGTEPGPPYLAVLAALSAVLLGSTGLTLTVLLVCSVPLAGITAYFASRSLVENRLLRAWAAVAYAFLPAAAGALATGRIGTAVLAVLLPMIARAGVSAYGLRGGSGGPRGTWRATWAFTFLLTFTMAFTPVVWPLAVLLGLAGVVLHRSDLRAYAARFLLTLVTPMIVLAPWSLSLLTHPGEFLREAGLETGTGSASALDLLDMSPGGPKALGGLLLIGTVLAALGALLRSERQFAVRTAWAVALVGLIFAVLTNDKSWAGPATLVYALALLAAAMVGAEGARERVASQSFGWRQPVAALVALLAALAPVVAAFGWMIGGAADPLRRTDATQVPAFVAEEATTTDQPRTLVLDGTSAGHVSYALVRGSGGRLGDAELLRAAGGSPKLDSVVANLVAGSGADQTSRLSGYAIGYVLLHNGAPHEMGRVLDATPGLTRLSRLNGSELWRVDQEVSRVAIVSAKGTGTPVPVAAGPVDAHTKIPAGTAGRVLRVADSASDGWTATLDGKPLTRTTVDGWAQGFELPAQGGSLDLTYDEPLTHTVWVWTQVLLGLVLLVMALPGRRRDIDDDLPEEALAAVPPEALEGDGRRARRLRAAAEAEAAAAAAAGALPEEAAGPDGPTPAHGTSEDPYRDEGAYAPTADPYETGEGGYEQPEPYDPARAYDPQAPYSDAEPYDTGTQQAVPGALPEAQEAEPAYGAYTPAPYGGYEDGDGEDGDVFTPHQGGTQPPGQDPYASVPHQQGPGTWDYGTYGAGGQMQPGQDASGYGAGYPADPAQGAPYADQYGAQYGQQAYDQGAYEQGQGQDPYQQGAGYHPYPYAGQQQPHAQGQENEQHPDGSSNQ